MTNKRTETHSCDNQYCIQNGGDICDRIHCPIGQKQTFYDDITDEQEQLDFVQKHERIPVVIKAETHGDVISRQDATDALERIFDRCEEIEAHLPEGDPDRVGYKMYPDWLTVWKYLRQMPSTKPEIIRCKDCEWWEKQKDSLQGRCALMQMYPTGQWYCGNAQRRVSSEKADIS